MTHCLRKSYFGKLGLKLAGLLILAWGWGAAGLYANGPGRVHDDILSLSFPTEKDGWASGRWGTIRHTADGGVTWRPQESGTETTLVSIFFTDTRNGWAVGDEGLILHTSDGGNTWGRQKSPVDYFHMGVFFTSPKKGWIISERTHILSTEDGGENWRVKFKDQDFILKGISFADSLNGWVVGEFGYIYHTSDGGETWVRQAGYYDLDYATGELVGDPTLFDVEAIDAHTAMAVGVDGNVIRTDDAGETWTKVDVGLPRNPIYCIDSNGDKTIIVGGKGGCRYSTNGGRSWQHADFEPPIIYSWIYGISWRGAADYFVAGGESGAIYTNTSASTWRKVLY